MWVLPPGRVRDGLLGDLDELYAERVREGRTEAQLWYARQLVSAAIHYPAARLRGKAIGLRGLGARTTDAEGH